MYMIYYEIRFILCMIWNVYLINVFSCVCTSDTQWSSRRRLWLTDYKPTWQPINSCTTNSALGAHGVFPVRFDRNNHVCVFLCTVSARSPASCVHGAVLRALEAAGLNDLYDFTKRTRRHSLTFCRESSIMQGNCSHWGGRKQQQYGDNRSFSPIFSTSAVLPRLSGFIVTLTKWVCLFSNRLRKRYAWC